MNHLPRLLLALALAVPSLASHAAGETVVIPDIPAFLAHQQRLRDDLDTARKFAHMDLDSKRRIRTAQDELFRVLEKYASTRELNDDERVIVLNAESTIAAVLQDAELDRPICDNRPRIGSNRRQIECRSKRQRDADELSAKTFYHWRRVCDDPKLCTVTGADGGTGR